MKKCFSQSQLQAIADALGDTSNGLTGSEIHHLLASAQIEDTDPLATKRHCLYNAFVNNQNPRQDRSHILAFIRKAMKPGRFLREQEKFEPLRQNLNGALLFAGLAVNDKGEIISAQKAQTLSDATKRAQELKAALMSRDIHPDVLIFCREELLKDNYFHAVFEAAKSVADKIRKRTGLIDDGVYLAQRALDGNIPLLAINDLKTESEKEEQKGFSNLVKGAFNMFRNTTGHAPKIYWHIAQQDAEDILSLFSLIHRRLDRSYMPPRT